MRASLEFKTFAFILIFLLVVSTIFMLWGLDPESPLQGVLIGVVIVIFIFLILLPIIVKKREVQD